MLGAVIEITGWDPVAAASVTLCAASHDVPAVCTLNGQTWWPAIAKLPTLRYDLFDGAFAGRIEAPSGSCTLGAEPWPDLGRYALADATFRLWTGEVGAAWASWTLRFDGRVTQQPQVADGRAELQVAVDDRWLDQSLLDAYAGTTGIEGPAALKGTVKPLALGAPRYVPGTLIDSVNSVFQISAYGAIEDVEAALERLARYGAPTADYASYDALVAAAVPAGRWATSKAAGLVRFGAPPAGKISFLVKGDKAGPDGWARQPGAIVRRIAQRAGGLARVDAGNLAALTAARPYNLSLYLDAQTTARELLQRLAASLNCVAVMTWTGTLLILPVAIGAASVTLAADGSMMPPVAKVEQIAVDPPFKALAIGAERTWSVHALNEIAFTATLVDMGAYAAGTTYREGNIVQHQSSSWLYINPAPSAGNAPPALPTTANTWWKVLAKAGDKGDKGDDGVSSYAVLMSNEAHILPADADGNVTSYNGASTNLQVIYGGEDVTSSFTLSITDNPQSLAATVSGNVVTVTGGLDAGEPNAVLKLRMTGSGSFAGVALDRQFSLTKSRAGADGTSPALLQIVATPSYAKYDATNTYVGGDITFKQTRQNMPTGSYAWRVVTAATGTVQAEGLTSVFALYPDAFSSTGDDNLTLKPAFVAALLGSGAFYVEAYSPDHPGIADRTTITAVRDGANGTNGIDGTNGTDGRDGTDGANGVSSFVHLAYANSADGTVDFTTAAPGGRAYVGIYRDQVEADSTNPASYYWSRLKGIDGTNGTNGTPGAPGANGQTPYTHFAYATAADGSTGFSTSDPTGRTYLGVYTDFTEADSNSPSAYTWSLIKGVDGEDGAPGANGADGFGLIPSPATFTIPAFSDGTAKPAWTGGSCTIALNKGGVEVAADSYSFHDAVNMASIAISGQTITFADITADKGEFVARATRGGVDYDQKVIVTKVRDGSAAFSSSTTIIALGTKTANTTVPAGRTVRISASATYSAGGNPGGGQTASAKARITLYWRNLTDGGAAQLLGSADGSTATRTNTGTTSEPEYSEVQGVASASFTFTSPSPDKQIEYRVDVSTITGSPGTFSGPLKLEVIA